APVGAMRLAVVSAKASPGATTLVQALASAWPEGRRLLVAEVDGSGGSLAARLRLAPDPGLLSLATSGRRGVTVSLLNEHCQSYGGLDLLLAPATARQTKAALD